MISFGENSVAATLFAKRYATTDRRGHDVMTQRRQSQQKGRARTDRERVRIADKTSSWSLFILLFVLLIHTLAFFLDWFISFTSFFSLDERWVDEGGKGDSGLTTFCTILVTPSPRHFLSCSFACAPTVILIFP